MSATNLTETTEQPKPVVNAYIDGYNFYYSINRYRLRLGWCDFGELAERLARRSFSGAILGAVKYFTATVGAYGINPGEADRQKLWLDALRLGSKHKVQIIKGFYDKDEDKPRKEKQTDTNLAISMVRDALPLASDDRHQNYDEKDRLAPCNRIILISADRDLLPPARLIASYGMEVAIFHPLPKNLPNGKGEPAGISLRALTENDLEASLLPDRIERKDAAPITWEGYLAMRNRPRRDRSREISDSFALCRNEAAKSLDQDTQVGCVIRRPDGLVVATGYNSLPDHIADLPGRLSKPGKYAWIEHAERNAIYTAARSGKKLDECTMYVDLAPCANCARAIIQSGIRQVIVSAARMKAYTGSTYREEQEIAEAMLKESGVRMEIL